MTNFSLNEIISFMQQLGIEFITPYGEGELIMSQEEGIYMSLDGLTTMQEVEARYLQSVSRPIGKSLPASKAEHMLAMANSYFGSQLTREDMLDIYTYLCYREKLKATEEFIRDGFPMKELRKQYGGA